MKSEILGRSLRTTLVLCCGLGVAAAAKAAPTLLQQAQKAVLQAQQQLDADQAQRQKDQRELAQALKVAYTKLTQQEALIVKKQNELTTQQKKLAESNNKIRGPGEDSVEQLLRRAAQQTEPSITAEQQDIAQQEQELRHRLEKLSDGFRVYVAEEKIADRSGQHVVIPVLHIGHVQSWALGESERTSGRLGALVAGVASLAQQTHDTTTQRELQAWRKDGRASLIPLDFQNADAPEQQNQTSLLARWWHGAEWFGAIIACVGLLSLVLVIERLWTLLRHRPNPDRLREVTRLMRAQRFEDVKTLVATPKTDLDRIICAGLDARRYSDMETRSAALDSALLAEEPRLERSLGMLSACAGVAPLLGLLGTVTGMITTFSTISQRGAGDPRLLSGGISMALVATEMGLTVAIPVVVFHALLSRVVRRREALLEEACSIMLEAPPSEDDTSIEMVAPQVKLSSISTGNRVREA